MEPNAPRPQDGPTAEPRRKRVVVTAVAAGLAVLTAVLWVTGGLKNQPNGPAIVKQGAAVNQGRFTVNVLSARIGQVEETLGTKKVTALIVRLRVVNNGKDSASLSGALKDGFAGEPRPGTYLEPGDVTGMAGGGETTSVYPGLPVEAEATWELKPGNAPRQVTVVLRQWEYAPGFTDLSKHWTVDKSAPIAAKVTLPVSAQ